MPTPAFGSQIRFSDVTTEFGLTVNPPSRGLGADFRFAAGTYYPITPVIPTGATATIKLSSDLGGRTYVFNNGIPTWIATMNFGVGNQGVICCLDTSENIYVGGALTVATATAYNAGTATGTNSTYVATTLGGVAIAKYNSSGVVQWVTEIDGAGNDQFGSVVFTNNLYACGRAGTTWPTAWDAGSSVSGQTMNTSTVPTATIGFYVAKYNSSGIAQFMVGYGNSGGVGTNAHTLAIDPSENVYISARAGGPVQTAWAFGPGGTTNINYPTPSTSTTVNCIVIKWNSAGTPQWIAFIKTTLSTGYGTGVAWNNAASQVGVTANSGGSVQAVAYDANQNPQTTGITCTKASGTSSTLVAAYNAAGVAQWITLVDNTLTNDIKACGYLSSDSAGNWYVCGTSASGLAPVAYSAGTTTGTTAALTPLLTGAWLVKFNSSGAVQWIAMIDSTSSVSNYGMSVYVDMVDNIYVTVNTTTAGATVNAYNAGSSTIALTSLTPTGTSSVVVKYNTSGTVQNMMISYDGTTFTYFVGNNQRINNKLYSTFTGTAGTWTAYGTDNTSNVVSANTGTGILVKYV